jgi:hypothetical protein
MEAVASAERAGWVGFDTRERFIRDGLGIEAETFELICRLHRLLGGA